jgi:hypothetical protein
MIFGHDIGTWERMQIEVVYLVTMYPHLSRKDIQDKLQEMFGSRPTRSVLDRWINRAQTEAAQ